MSDTTRLRSGEADDPTVAPVPAAAPEPVPDAGPPRKGPRRTRDLTPPTTPTPLAPRDYRLPRADLDIAPAAALPERSKASASRRRTRARAKRVRRLVSVAAVLATVVVVALALRLFLLEPFTVPSSEMSPALHSGDRILVLKSSFLSGTIHRGQVIVFARPTDFPCTKAGGSGSDLVQRVIGLPGETIWSNQKTIFVNGRPLPEKGWFNSRYGPIGSKEIPHTKIPQGDYFVMADHRNDTCDSRSFGVIPSSSTVGRVVAIITRNGSPYLHFL